MTWRVLEGDCRDVLRTLPDASVQTVVTSPPYFGLRDYGTSRWEGGDPDCQHDAGGRGQVPQTKHPNAAATIVAGGNRGAGRECLLCGARRVDTQIGLEPTPDEFADALVCVFRDVRRVLRDDGTVWLNLGDSYCSTPPGNVRGVGETSGLHGAATSEKYRETLMAGHATKRDTSRIEGVKQKDLLGIPWLVAFALRADGWYLRADIVWAKTNPMPESVRDRPTRSHEFLFLLTKRPRYFYDADAIREPFADARQGRDGSKRDSQRDRGGRADGFTKPNGRNKRDVWTVSSRPFKGAHFAVFPPDLIEPCILAGSSPKACGVCGAPWTRITKRRPTGYDGSRYGERAVEATGGAIDGGTAASTLGSSNGKLVAGRETVGWQPTCEHDDDSGRCVVLDPFSGAGTTGLVAVRHGRDYVGVELNPEYAEMSRRRIAEDPGPAGRPRRRARPAPAEQLTLEAVA